jgi:hypothetical protein
MLQAQKEKNQLQTISQNFYPFFAKYAVIIPTQKQVANTGDMVVGVIFPPYLLFLIAYGNIKNLCRL